MSFALIYLPPGSDSASLIDYTVSHNFVCHVSRSFGDLASFAKTCARKVDGGGETPREQSHPDAPEGGGEQPVDLFANEVTPSPFARQKTPCSPRNECIDVDSGEESGEESGHTEELEEEEGEEDILEPEEEGNVPESVLRSSQETNGYAEVVGISSDDDGEEMEEVFSQGEEEKEEEEEEEGEEEATAEEEGFEDRGSASEEESEETADVDKIMGAILARYEICKERESNERNDDVKVLEAVDFFCQLEGPDLESICRDGELTNEEDNEEVEERTPKEETICAAPSEREKTPNETMDEEEENSDNSVLVCHFKAEYEPRRCPIPLPSESSFPPHADFDDVIVADLLSDSDDCAGGEADREEEEMRKEGDRGDTEAPGETSSGKGAQKGSYRSMTEAEEQPKKRRGRKKRAKEDQLEDARDAEEEKGEAESKKKRGRKRQAVEEQLEGEREAEKGEKREESKRGRKRRVVDYQDAEEGGGEEGEESVTARGKKRDSDYQLDEEGDSEEGKGEEEEVKTGRKKQAKAEEGDAEDDESPSSLQNCPVDGCSSTFPEKIDLLRHMRSAHTWPALCAFCKTPIRTPSILRKHVIIHLGLKPHVCPHCGAKFNQSGSLKNHLRGHTGEKVHECRVCGRRFTERRNCEDHEAGHQGERRYECPHCHKRFARRSSFYVHRKEKHGE